jgi:hypothetical protein
MFSLIKAMNRGEFEYTERRYDHMTTEKGERG